MCILELKKRNVFLNVLILTAAVSLIFSLVYFIEDIVFYNSYPEDFAGSFISAYGYDVFDAAAGVVIFLLLLFSNLKKNKFTLLLAALIYIFYILFYHASIYYICCLTICFFAIWQMKRENTGLIPLALLIAYILSLCGVVIDFIKRLTASEDGVAIIDPGFSKLFYVIAMILIVAAIVLIYCGNKSDLHGLLKAGAIVYVFGILCLNFLAVREETSQLVIPMLIQIVFYPEVLLGFSFFRK